MDVGYIERTRGAIGRKDAIFRLFVKAGAVNSRGSASCHLLSSAERSLAKVVNVSAKIERKGVVLFDAVLKVVTIARNVVSNIFSNREVVGCMDGDTAVETLVNRRISEVTSVAAIAKAMVVDWVPAKKVRLAHSVELDALDKAFAIGPDHDVATKASEIFVGVWSTSYLMDGVPPLRVFVCAVIDIVGILRICLGSLNDNSSGKQANFALVVFIGDVRIPARFVKSNDRTNSSRIGDNGGDDTNLVLVPSSIVSHGRGDQNHLLTNLPIDRVLQVRCVIAGPHGFSQSHPSLGVSLAMEVERSAANGDALVSWDGCQRSSIDVSIPIPWTRTMKSNGYGCFDAAGFGASNEAAEDFDSAGVDLNTIHRIFTND